MFKTIEEITTKALGVLYAGHEIPTNVNAADVDDLYRAYGYAKAYIKALEAEITKLKEKDDDADNVYSCMEIHGRD